MQTGVEGRTCVSGENIFFAAVNRSLFLFEYRRSFNLVYIHFKPSIFNINRRKQTTKV